MEARNRGGTMAKVTRRLRRHEGTEGRSGGGTKPWRHDGQKDTGASEARRHRGTKLWRYETVEARRQKETRGFQQIVVCTDCVVGAGWVSQDDSGFSCSQVVKAFISGRVVPGRNLCGLLLEFLQDGEFAQGSSWRTNCQQILH